MLHAIETGKIQAGEAGLRGLRKELEKIFGMEVDISIIEIDGPFDNPPFIPIEQEAVIVNNNLYCKIYLDTRLEIEELYLLINELLAGELEPIRTIKTAWCEMDLRRNSEFDLKRLEKNSEDFIFWKYYLDVEPMDTDEKEYIKGISDLIIKLKGKEVKAVPSCGFEEALQLA